MLNVAGNLPPDFPDAYLFTNSVFMFKTRFVYSFKWWLILVEMNVNSARTE